MPTADSGTTCYWRARGAAVVFAEIRRPSEHLDEAALASGQHDLVGSTGPGSGGSGP